MFAPVQDWKHGVSGTKGETLLFLCNPILICAMQLQMQIEFKEA